MLKHILDSVSNCALVLVIPTRREHNVHVHTQNWLPWFEPWGGRSINQQLALSDLCTKPQRPHSQNSTAGCRCLAQM